MVLHKSFSRSALAFLALAVVLCCGQAGFAAEKQAKYVFFIIGDGMAQPQRTSTEMFLAAREGKPHGTVKLSMSKLPAQGMMTTHAANSIIPDSADTATAMACGVKTNSGMLGVTPDNKAVKNVAELAKEKGKKVGIISTVSIDHATPGGFYAHQESRDNYHEIAHELVKSGFDFFGGGGFKDPEGKKSKAPQGNAIEAAKAAGYKVVTGKEGFEKITKNDGKVIVINEWLQDSKAMPYLIDRTVKDMSLADLVAKAAEVLDGPQGFFIMAEGGKVDWACHANDAAGAIGDVLDVDAAVDVALAFQKKHPDETLILVTGDHECGGLTIGFAGTKYASFYHVLTGQKMSFQAFTDKMAEFKKNCGQNCSFDAVKPVIEESFGLKFAGDAKDAAVLKEFEVAKIKEAFDLYMAATEDAKGYGADGKDPQAYLLYGGYNPLSVTITHLLNQKAGLGWTSYSHTGVPVTVSAEGAGAAAFNGFYDNTDIAKKLKAAMGMPDTVKMAAN
ncbi:alkaline phosphatase [Desulfolutivibrio sulfoxidireducens]|nr:alkaline phosphatase [Desulfolutivibrio sulfoxidireducens]QLA21723.1 alkaline phosphatase [Desulfolutivibrio sulfoxidireducens]